MVSMGTIPYRIPVKFQRITELVKNPSPDLTLTFTNFGEYSKHRVMSRIMSNLTPFSFFINTPQMLHATGFGCLLNAFFAANLASI
ncbi:hypothetical protein BpHYR1_017311 [Brachionus plicatilis]|uniref:Uncharacterized protein n=1 Tax=Brachionus plicatilis TaxID=10195 RepID=A0A3M7R5J8_BRAPC|nr:hypothetical protein BpHYR1_017311 [Brachionus plicatilis]